MSHKYTHDKNKSQIVFDITGGEKNMTSMTMCTIPKKEKIVRSGNENFSLRTDDIKGAQPRGPPVQRHRDFYYNDDIEGSSPQPSVDLSKKPFDYMSVKDIQGASPAIQRSLPHSERHTNPLNPQYSLPSYHDPTPIPVPKFIRDNINYDDVPGVHSKSYKSDKPPRDIMKTDDINGASPKHLIKGYMGNRNLDVSDINKDGIFKTKRETNPLVPDYYYDGQHYPQDFGIQKSNYKTRRDHLDLSLKTEDIQGAAADSATQEIRNFKIPPPKEEDDYGQPAPVINVPSMAKATQELERQRRIDQYHGEVIRRFENRHLITNRGVDPAQNSLMNQRTQAIKNHYTKPTHVTFSVTDEDSPF